MSEQVYTSALLQQLAQRKRANFVNSLSGFKSANLVGTRSLDGIDNLALISSVFHVGASPALMGMLMRPHTVVRDTLQNIKDTGVYTINHVHKSFVDKAHQCSARYESHQSEFEEVGLNPQVSASIKAPYVLESKIKIALELQQITLIELNQTELVIGKVVEVIVDDKFLLNDGYIDIEKAGSVAVSCLDAYHSSQIIDRFSYAKPGEPLQSLKRNNNDPKS